MIVRAPRRHHYSVISNTALEDERLSWKARGLLAYLLSKPDNWEVRMEELRGSAPDGKHAIQGAMRELRNCGYAILTNVRTPDGKKTLGTRWVVSEHPEFQSVSLSAQKPARQECASLSNYSSRVNTKKKDKTKDAQRARETQAPPKPYPLPEETLCEDCGEVLVDRSEFFTGLCSSCHAERILQDKLAQGHSPVTPKPYPTVDEIESQLPPSEGEARQRLGPSDSSEHLQQEPCEPVVGKAELAERTCISCGMATDIVWHQGTSYCNACLGEQSPEPLPAQPNRIGFLPEAKPEAPPKPYPLPTDFCSETHPHTGDQCRYDNTCQGPHFHPRTGEWVETEGESSVPRCEYVHLEFGRCILHLKHSTFHRCANFDVIAKPDYELAMVVENPLSVEGVEETPPPVSVATHNESVEMQPTLASAEETSVGRPDPLRATAAPGPEPLEHLRDQGEGQDRVSDGEDKLAQGHSPVATESHAPISAPKFRRPIPEWTWEEAQEHIAELHDDMMKSIRSSSPVTNPSEQWEYIPRHKHCGRVIAGRELFEATIREMADSGEYGEFCLLCGEPIEGIRDIEIHAVLSRANTPDPETAPLPSSADSPPESLETIARRASKERDRLTQQEGKQ